MSQTRAWELSLTGDLRVAVGEQQLVHIIDAPELHHVPCTPKHCDHVVVWRDTVLPVMDLANWLQPRSRPQVPSLAGVVAYSPHPESPIEYGALPFAAAPKRITIADEQACGLPRHQQGWRAFTLVCFIDARGQPSPILDLARAFSPQLHSA